MATDVRFSGFERGSHAADPESNLVGRDAELATFRKLVEESPVVGRLEVIVGQTGLGRTALIDEAARLAQSANFLVLSTKGSRCESQPLGALRRLLHNVINEANHLPVEQGRILRETLSTHPESATENPLLMRLSTLALLARLSKHSPVLLLVDDAHCIDTDSLDILTFVGHRLTGIPVVILLSTTPNEPLLGVRGLFPEMALRCLSEQEANQLLNQLPAPLKGAARARVIAKGAGNPALLIALANATASGLREEVRRSSPPQLSSIENLNTSVAMTLAGLSVRAREALLNAAAAEGSDHWLASGHGFRELDPAILAPAEELGLIRVGPAGLDFAHPLIRTAVYDAAPLAQRAKAHLQLAAGLRHEPDRRAWHIAAATIGPNERVASLLESTVQFARQREGAASAAALMERAAELTVAGDRRARRYLSAAELARSTGHADWVRESGRSRDGVRPRSHTSKRCETLDRMGIILVKSTTFGVRYVDISGRGNIGELSADRMGCFGRCSPRCLRVRFTLRTTLHPRTRAEA